MVSCPRYVIVNSKTGLPWLPLTFLPCDVTKTHERSDLIADLMMLVADE